MKKTYQQKKDEIRQQAIDYSNNFPENISYMELAEIQYYFETMGKRYGLLKEFQENGIC